MLLLYMKSRSFRFLKVLLIVIFSIVVILAISGKILSGYAEKTIKEKLASMNASIKTLDINLFTRSISATEFQWSPPSDYANRVPHRAQVADISISGIGIINYLINHKLSISSIILSDGDITYDQIIKTVQQEAQSKSPVTEVAIDKFTLKNFQAKLVRDTITEYSAKINFTLGGVRLINYNNPPEQFSYVVKSAEVLAEDIVADRDLPPCNRVTMDGIAVRFIAFENDLRSFKYSSPIII